MNTIKNILLIALLATQPVLAMDLPDPNDLGMQLLKAALENDIQQVNALLAQGANVNLQGNWGFTALLYAASRGNQEIVKKLIDSNADLNKNDLDRDTALMYAARGKHPEIITMLIDAKADISCKNNIGNTAIIIAAINGYEECVKTLIAAGAEINIRNNANLTALTIAAMHSYTPICNCLIEANFKRSQEEKKRVLAFLVCLKYLPCGQPKGQKNTHYSHLKNIFKKTLISSIQEPRINMLAQIHEVRNPRIKDELLRWRP
jgi:ankyrin repeat protein